MADSNLPAGGDFFAADFQAAKPPGLISAPGSATPGSAATGPRPSSPWKTAEQPPQATVEERTTEDQLGPPPGKPVMAERAPPWLISLLVHMSVIVVLGMITIAKLQKPVIQISVFDAAGETEFDQLDALPIEAPDITSNEAVFVPSQLPAVSDPLIAPPVSLDGFTALEGMGGGGRIEGPMGLALSGRQAGRKEGLVRRFGGTSATQEAVRLALEWLKRNQLPNGSWSLQGPYANLDGVPANSTVATALALLAFQGDGHTHRAGEHKDVVKRGWSFLIKQQYSDGRFGEEGPPTTHQMYTHAIATMAICELYGMTNDSKFRSPAEMAVGYCVKAQDKAGGWRYVPADHPASSSDTSVTGWFVLALQSAKMARLRVPAKTFENISKFLDTMQSDDGSQYRYFQGSYFSPAMTAEAMLCRQYLGWKQNDPRLLSGAAYLATNPVEVGDAADIYYWYYATQFMHHLEGAHWRNWNKATRKVLPETQIKDGPERGSWDPAKYKWGDAGGRLFVTCLNVFMLEVYYRHLPLYRNPYDETIFDAPEEGTEDAAMAEDEPAKKAAQPAEQEEPSHIPVPLHDKGSGKGS